MKQLIQRIYLVALIVIGAGGAGAIPVPVLDVPSLAADSGLIIVGNVESIRDAGSSSVSYGGQSLPARAVSCGVQVEAVLKGASESRQLSFQYVLPNDPIGYGSIVLGYQMLFLRKGNAGYSLASPYHASLPAVSGVEAVAGNELVNIATQLGAVLQSPAVPLGQKQIALFAISTIRNPESTDLLRLSLRQRDATLRLNAAGFLLLRDDLSGLEPAELALTHPDSAPSYILHNLNYAIGEGVRNEKAVPSLSRLAHARDSETRRAAATALRRTGSRSALEPLARLLDDSDLQVRHDAVVGLAQISGDLEWGPNLDLFQSQEQRYLKHWHDWVREKGVSP